MTDLKTQPIMQLHMPALSRLTTDAQLSSNNHHPDVFSGTGECGAYFCSLLTLSGANAIASPASQRRDCLGGPGVGRSRFVS